MLERHEEIVRIIRRRKRISVPELSQMLGISEVTIRKDLTGLQEKGLIIRTRGGAILAEEKDLTKGFSQKVKEQADAKARIGQKAAEFVRTGDSILLDAGSTTLQLARAINHLDLRVVTNSLAIAYELAPLENIRLLVLGGLVRSASLSMMGPITETNLQEIAIETAFLGTTGFDLYSGYTLQNSIEAQTKKIMIQRAKRKIILADHTKFGQTAFSVFARLEDIDVIITDDNMPEENQAQLKAKGIDVIFA